ncbi:hypothetical protein EI42_05232 [Thermosporothrix hazakensis]|jgi:hypothetical protein|uniref:Uncharacterized protein n=1 Tax=Thermosporothrix hazakensis TaxID=644383 RepID=A0A326U0L7_THEHA|nr:hypothetical protein EI42_05232 [Thermosporothrix hazakensis]GCE48021.1 hypothetical protein KTH_28900 [Thermosporothrix hazakensis]
MVDRAERQATLFVNAPGLLLHTAQEATLSLLRLSFPRNFHCLALEACFTQLLEPFYPRLKNA